MLVPWKGVALPAILPPKKAVHYLRIFQLMYLKPPALICYCNSAVHNLLAVIAIMFKNTSSMLLQYLDSSVQYLLAFTADRFKTTTSRLYAVILKVLSTACWL
jgi:hypothetical protein